MNNKIIGVDIDDTCLDLMSNWLSFYNKDYNDNLTPDKITDWSTHLFVKPECGKKIYSYIEKPDVFISSKPIEDALFGINWLREKNFRVIFITASNPNGVKEQWLKENNFWSEKEDFYQAYDKSLIRAHVLLDDKYENVANFKIGQPFLFTQPWNQKYYFKDRVKNWKEFINEIAIRFMWDII